MRKKSSSSSIDTSGLFEQTEEQMTEFQRKIYQQSHEIEEFIEIHKKTHKPSSCFAKLISLFEIFSQELLINNQLLRELQNQKNKSERKTKKEKIQRMKNKTNENIQEMTIQVENIQTKIQNELDISHEQIKKLQSKNSRLQQQLKIEKENNEEYTNQLSELNFDIEDKKRNIEELAKMNKYLEKENEKILETVEKYKVYKNKYISMEENYKKAKADLESKTNQVNQQNKEINEYKSTLRERDHSIFSLNKSIQHKESKIKELQASKNGLKSVNNKLQFKVSEYAGENEILNNEIIGYQEKLADYSQLKVKLNELAIENSNLSKINKKKDNQIRSLISNIEDIKMDLKQVSSDFKSLYKAYKEGQNDRAQSMKLIEDLQKKLDEISENETELLLQANGLINQLEDRTHSDDKYRKELNKQKSMTEEIRKENGRLSRKIIDLQNEIEVLHKLSDQKIDTSYFEKIAVQAEQINALKHQNNNLEDRLSHLQSEVRISKDTRQKIKTVKSGIKQEDFDYLKDCLQKTRLLLNEERIKVKKLLEEIEEIKRFAEGSRESFIQEPYCPRKINYSIEETPDEIPKLKPIIKARTIKQIELIQRRIDFIQKQIES